MNRRITAVLLSALLTGCGPDIVSEEETPVPSTAAPNATETEQAPQIQAAPSWVKVALRVQNTTNASEFCHVNIAAGESHPSIRSLLGTFCYRNVDAGGEYSRTDVFAGTGPIHVAVDAACGPAGNRRHVERRFVLNASATISVTFAGGDAVSVDVE